MMAFTYINRAALWLAVFTAISISPVSANPMNNNASQCKNHPTASCFLEKTFDLIQSLPSGSEKEKLLIELGFESYLLNKKELFSNTMVELEKTNLTLRNSLPTALKKLSSLIKSKKNSPSIPNTLFSSVIAKQLFQEEILLISIKNRTMSTEHLIASPLSNKPFNDSLQWNAAYIYYLTLTRDVSLKKSTELKRFLIKQLAQSPLQQHQQKNLEISLLETLGGSIKQGEETRLISNINGFSPHHLVQLNQRIIFYQQFTKFYNTKVGLNQDECTNPLKTMGNSLDVFFSSKNLSVMKQLDALTIKDPNDYLLTSIIIQHLNSCTPLSHFFQQRYLQSLSNIPSTKGSTTSSVKYFIRHLRSLRRYTKI
jgi:hypothetical protein